MGCHGVDPVAVSLKIPNETPVLFPDLNQPILAGCVDEVLAAPDNFGDGCLVPTKNPDALQIVAPQFDGLVFGRREEIRAAFVFVERFPRQRRDKLLVSLNRAACVNSVTYLFLVLHVEQRQVAIRVSGNQILVVGTESDAEHPVLVRLEGFQGRFSLDVPESYY